jgi:excisionase family DNA binding protein
MHDRPVNVLATINAHWLRAAQSPGGQDPIAVWRRRCPRFDDYHSAAEVVATINQHGYPDRSCALLADLLMVADGDPFAQLAVLQALLPGLRRVVRQRWRTAAGGGPWPSQEDLAADAVSAAFEAISHRAGQTHTRPARLILRRVERRLRTIHDAHRRDITRAVPLTPHSEIAAVGDHAEEEHFATELRRAVHAGRLDPATAALAFRIAVLGEPAAAAGRQDCLDLEQTRNNLRHVLDVLAGATRADQPTDRSRPAVTTSTEEVHLVASIHHPGDHSRPEPSTAVPLPLLLTVKQASQLLGLGRSTLYELLDAGELRSVKRGASRRIPLQEIHGYIDRLLNQADSRNRSEALARPEHDASNGPAPAPRGERPADSRQLRRPPGTPKTTTDQISLFPATGAGAHADGRQSSHDMQDDEPEQGPSVSSAS